MNLLSVVKRWELAGNIKGGGWGDCCPSRATTSEESQYQLSRLRPLVNGGFGATNSLRSTSLLGRQETVKISELSYTE